MDQKFQRVVIQGITSSWADIISGVPQGSVLGPILLLLLLEKTNLSCPKQASRTGYKVSKTVQYTINSKYTIYHFY